MSRLKPIVFAFLLFAQLEARDYHVPLTASDQQNIRYIITTLGTHSSVGLLFYKSNLEAAGNKVAHVHPLKFLAYIFSNPELTSDAKNIGSMPWNRFVNDMADSLAKEAQRKNISQTDLKDFSRSTGISLASIEPFIMHQQWHQFINFLRDQGS